MKWVQHLFTFKETPRERAGNSQRVAWRQGYFGLIKSTVRFEKWNEILDGKTIPVYDKPEQQAWRHWAMGLAYSATGQPEKAQGRARRPAEASRRGDVGQGADRHRLPGARSDDRGARRRPQEGVRAVQEGGRPRSGHALHRAAGVSAAGHRRAGRTWRWRSATSRSPRRRTASCSSSSPAAAAPTSGWPRRSTVWESRPRRATRASRAAKAWANADASLPQVQVLKTSTAAPQQ